jgi:hypothetical protein
LATAPFLIGMIVGSLIVLVGWAVVVALVVIFTNRKVKAMLEAHPEVQADGRDSMLLFYALAVFFWPAAFVSGIHFMGDPKTVRAGRNCVFIGLANISSIVLLTCIGMALLAALAPGTLR